MVRKKSIQLKSLDFAEKQAVDMLFVGPIGIKRYRILSSWKLPGKVVRNSKVPVLVIHGKSRKKDKNSEYCSEQFQI